MLTPQDIANKEFKKGVHGYDAKEVEQFLREVSENYEKLYKENLAVNEQVRMLSDAVKQYKAMEDSLSLAKTDDKMEYQYEQMKHSMEVFRAKMVSLLQAQLDIIKEYSYGNEEGEPQEKQRESLCSEHTEQPHKKTPIFEQETAELPKMEHTQEIAVDE